MKLASITASPLPCTCGHLDLSLEGDTCEICMGNLYQAAGESIEPQSFRFDIAYFEAWEAYQTQLEKAA